MTFILDKRNPINKYFSKFCWGWTSLVFFLSCLFSLDSVARIGLPKNTKLREIDLFKAKHSQLNAFVNYVFATGYWIFLTQWLFGPSIFDRVFTYTGGGCFMFTAISDNDGMGSDLGQVSSVYQKSALVSTFQQCRKAGGTWEGGVDISGHCFLLFHSAIFLVYVVLPLATVHRKENISTVLKLFRAILIFSIYVLIYMWAFSLLITSWKFHHFAETFTGSLFAVMYWYLKFFLSI
ncbi:hypothetical protein BB560_001947 [Smittium megazygosporum]|uniref:Uncharacterized protein n=1 Tax=Smittium megazygosporum TaxID=133381 RepID=A0A2T9ZGC2_9FUNG|nr:hypothetical protein BB560_001947 [Smittium megazygosporum]